MERNERTRKLLIMHVQKYPDLEIRDLLKFLHQSAFGCEHMITSAENATEGIKREYMSVPKPLNVPQQAKMAEPKNDFSKFQF